ncbi:MAG: hypothetical protein ACI814_004731, partial [Mariniblastus sp.]
VASTPSGQLVDAEHNPQTTHRIQSPADKPLKNQ